MPTLGIAPAAPASLAGLVTGLKRAWREGEAPDAAGALRAHPELLGHRSLVVDLAYEEYCLREEAGRPPDPDAFCRDLPAFRSQVREVLRGHREIADHPELFDSSDAAWPGPGDRCAGLTVVQELGRGAFARAYLARDPDTGDKPVVLKLSRAASGEARTLGPVRHPNVVGVHWARPADGLFALCLPFVGAATLRDVIDAAFDPAAGRRSARTILDAVDRAAAPLPESPDPAPALLDGRSSYPEATAAVFARLAGALAHLHRLGVAHGDLKPSNVLLGPGAHPYLIDFNLAGGRDDSVLRCGGTVPYMAPERLRLLLGASKDAGPADKADVYSFGVMLFEALTGRLPYEPPAGADGPAAAADLLRQSAAGMARPAGVPRPLARLVEACLATDPARRPKAEEVERALARYPRPRPRRSRAMIAAAGLAAAGLIAWQLSVPTPGPSAGVPDSPDASSPRPARPGGHFEEGIEFLRGGKWAAAWDAFDAADRERPDGRTTAYVAYCLSKLRNYTAAEACYERARVVHGYDAAWARNNRAHALIHLGSAPELRLAAAEAEAALRMDPGLRAARLNRPYARFLEVYMRDPSGRPVADPGLVTDIRIALGAGPKTQELYYKAAQIVLTFGGGTEETRAEAVRYLAEAVPLGRNPKPLAKDPLLTAHLMGRADFARLVNLPVPEPVQPLSGSPSDPHLAQPAELAAEAPQ